MRTTGAPADSSLAHNTARALRKYHPLELDGGDRDVMKMAAGTAVLAAMKCKGHSTDRLGVAPTGTAEALQYIVTYVVSTTPFTFDGGGAACAERRRRHQRRGVRWFSSVRSWWRHFMRWQDGGRRAERHVSLPTRPR